MIDSVNQNKYVREVVVTSYSIEECPSCSTENWFYGGHTQDIVGRRVPEDGFVCWKCNHRWITFLDKGDFQIYCEDHGIREGVDEEWFEGWDPGEEPEIEYETMEEYLADDSNCCFGFGARFVDVTKVEDRREVYEELKEEFEK